MARLGRRETPGGEDPYAGCDRAHHRSGGASRTRGAAPDAVRQAGGPRWKTPADAFFNRGKRRISLDLKKASDRATAQRLVASADVVIENFRPDVMDRLGLGAQAMMEHHPRLIYCSIPGFAPDDRR